jgi:hypothetical protein
VDGPFRTGRTPDAPLCGPPYPFLAVLVGRRGFLGPAASLRFSLCGFASLRRIRNQGVTSDGSRQYEDPIVSLIAEGHDAFLDLLEQQKQEFALKFGELGTQIAKRDGEGRIGPRGEKGDRGDPAPKIARGPSATIILA